MVSSAVASVDARIQQAEQVLDELSEQGLSLISVRQKLSVCSDGPYEPIATATTSRPVRHYSRPKVNAADAEFLEWAEDFICAVLGPSAGREPDWIDPEGGRENDG